MSKVIIVVYESAASAHRGADVGPTSMIGKTVESLVPLRSAQDARSCMNGRRPVDAE